MTKRKSNANPLLKLLPNNLFLSFLIIIGFIVVVVFLSIFAYDKFRIQDPTARIGSTQSVLTGIKPMGQLVSISAQLAKADIYVGVAQGALNACGFSANHVAQGAVEAGIDLTRLTESSVSYNENTHVYTITLPPPQLTSCRVEFIRQYDRSVTACPVDWDEARLLANYESLVGFRDDALKGGILKRAEDEARAVIGQFINLATGQEVEIKLSESPDSSSILPPSCQPDAPPGWEFNTESNAWVKTK